MKKQSKAEKVVEAPKVKGEKKVEETSPEKKVASEDVPSASAEGKEKVEKKKEQKKIPKKTLAEVNALSVPVSTKVSRDICKFILGKKVDDAVNLLEEVSKMKKVVPMKGEIPHRRGKIMSGRFPHKAAKEILILVKSLRANSLANGLENPIISEAISNKASRPFGRFGRVQRKRTHIALVAREKKSKEKGGQF